MDKRTFYLHNKESKKPFKIYDVSDFDHVYIDGNLFPIEINNEKLSIKDKRSPKPFKQHDEMIQRFVDAGITFEEEGEVELALSILPTINYYRMSVYRLFMDEDKSFTRLNQLYEFDTKLRESSL